MTTTTTDGPPAAPETDNMTPEQLNTPLALALYDFWLLAKEIAATESISIEEAVLEACALWEHLHAAEPPKTEATPIFAKNHLLAKTA